MKDIPDVEVNEIPSQENMMRQAMKMMNNVSKLPKPRGQAADFTFNLTDDISATIHIYDSSELPKMIELILDYDWSIVQKRLNKIHPKNYYQSHRRVKEALG